MTAMLMYKSSLVPILAPSKLIHEIIKNNTEHSVEFMMILASGKAVEEGFSLRLYVSHSCHLLHIYERKESDS